MLPKGWNSTTPTGGFWNWSRKQTIWSISVACCEAIGTLGAPPSPGEPHGPGAFLVLLGASALIVLILKRSQVSMKADRAKDVQRLARVAPGTEKIVTTAAPEDTMARYIEAGWSVVGQSSAKSFGTSLKVTLRFRKEPGT